MKAARAVFHRKLTAFVDSRIQSSPNLGIPLISHPRTYTRAIGTRRRAVTVKPTADILQAPVDSDYDWEKLEVIPINDRSEDRTQEIIDRFAARYPFIQPLHRTGGPGGKPAALVEARRRARY